MRHKWPQLTKAKIRNSWRDVEISKFSDCKRVFIRSQDPISDGFVMASPAERKEPPPKNPPIKSPKKPKKPIGDPPPNRKIKNDPLKSADKSRSPIL